MENANKFISLGMASQLAKVVSAAIDNAGGGPVNQLREDLANPDQSEGASLVGFDSEGIYPPSTVGAGIKSAYEQVDELKTDLSSPAAGEGAALVGFSDTESYPDGTVGAGIISADAKAVALKEDLASTDPDKGAAMVVDKLPYTATIGRTQNDINKDLVSVTDFGVVSDSTAMFQNAMAAASEYGRDLYIPKLDAGAKYSIGQNVVVASGIRLHGAGSGSGSGVQDPGSLLEFEDSSLILSNTNGLTLENFRVSRVGTTPGAAIECATEGTGGFYRNFFNNISVVGSNDIGVRMSGGWLFTWLNPYIRSCRVALVVTTGAHVTGMNSMTLVGGEIQSNTDAGIVLDRCKQFNVVGTAIEGTFGPGIGLGASPGSINILGYFEANQGGHIRPYSYNGGASGVAQCLVIQGGSYMLRGSGSTQSPANIPMIEITTCRQFHMEPGVFAQGYAGQTAPLIQVTDSTDSNKAFGSISGIQTDCPADLVLQNNCNSFGDDEFRSSGLNAVLPDDVNSDSYTVSVMEGPTVRNPALFGSLYLNFNVAGAGDVVLIIRRFDKTGTQIGAQIVRTISVHTGLNQYSDSVADSENLGFVTVYRSGSSASDTATGVTLLSIEYRARTNKVKTI